MLNKPDEVTLNLISTGYRITPVRGLILETFRENLTPIAASDLIEVFKDLKFKVNKTTIYRELDFLIEKGILKEIEFGEGKKRYEIETGRHHHHIICIKCKKIEDVDLEVDLEGEEKKIEKDKKFKIKNHSLEFFGYCKNCQL